MNTFILKLILAPVIIGGASLAGRRWGPAVSGWLVGLPLTSGPVIFFLALSQRHDIRGLCHRWNNQWRLLAGCILSSLRLAGDSIRLAHLADCEPVGLLWNRAADAKYHHPIRALDRRRDIDHRAWSAPDAQERDDAVE